MKVLCFLFAASLGFSQEPSDPLMEAQILINSGNYQKSYELLAPYLAGHPTNAGGYKIFAIAGFMLGKSDEALRSMRRSIELNPTDADSYYYLGRLYSTRNDPVEALKAFQHALLLQPTSVRSLNQLGQTYEALGRFSDAENAYLAAMDSDAKQAKKSEWPYYNLAILYANTGRSDRSVPLFLQALERNPRFAEAKIKLSVEFSKEGRIADARKFLEEAVAIDPSNAEGHYRLGLLLARTGDQKRSEEHLQRFAELKKR